MREVTRHAAAAKAAAHKPCPCRVWRFESLRATAESCLDLSDFGGAAISAVHVLAMSVVHCSATLSHQGRHWFQ